MFLDISIFDAWILQLFAVRHSKAPQRGRARGIPQRGHRRAAAHIHPFQRRKIFEEGKALQLRTAFDEHRPQRVWLRHGLKCGAQARGGHILQHQRAAVIRRAVQRKAVKAMVLLQYFGRDMQRHALTPSLRCKDRAGRP